MPFWCESSKILRRPALLAVAATLLAACGSTIPSPPPTSPPASSSAWMSDATLSATPTAAVTRTPAPTSTPAAAASPTPLPTAPPWRPAVGDTFQIQYAGTISLSAAASVYDLDVDDTPASMVNALHAKGRHVLCYIDAGAWESYRSDAASFPAAVLGKTMDGWPDERWLDIRQIDTLAPILRHRLDTCAAKGFDGVDPDNVNGYTNATGFPLTAANQLRFNRWLADEAHKRGLFIALKNDGDQAAAFTAIFDAAVVEQCVEYSECSMYSSFVAAGKPVFDIEYSRAPSAFCPVAAKLHFAIIGKHLALDAYRTNC
jgi:hypothetical protein